ncbi:MAG: peptide ABC transporter substrate-binding protein [Candidatus Cryosericum sp.]|nr:peptide ABC transporter substrate-binding protein [bacterium]
MRRVLSVVLMVALVAASLFGAVSCSTASKAVVQEVTYNLGTEPATIDPALSQGIPEANVILQVFDGLTRIDKDNMPQPAIAESWVISDDQKTYTFTLRDAVWTNGTPVTAYDFEYAWIRALAPETASQYAYQLYYIKGGEAFNMSVKVEDKYYVQAVDAQGNPVTKKQGDKDVPVPDMTKEIVPSRDVAVKALDDKTLQVTLESPTVYFLNLTAFPTLMPVCKAVVSTNDKWAADVTNFVTNGPFTLTEWSHNDKMTFVKNSTYWDKDSVKLDKITYLMVTDESTALSMFQNGQMDVGSTVPLAELPKLVASGDAKIFPYLGTYYYMFNVTKKPFDDVRVRKALTLAIDRNAIVTSITQGGQVAALAYVPYGIADATPGSDFRRVGGTFYKDNDIAAAKALLAEAGYPDGKGFPAFTILYNTSSAHKSIAEAIQQMWSKNLGITCTLKVEEWGVYLDDRNNLNYEVARAGWIGDYMDPNTFLDMFVTNGGNNGTGWGNKAYDADIAKAKATSDPVARMATLHDAEKILMTDMPIMPVYFYTNPVLITKHVMNFYQSTLGFVDWKNAYME